MSRLAKAIQSHREFARSRRELNRAIGNAFTPAMRDAFWQLFPSADPNRTLVAASLAASEVYAAILDGHLAGRDYAVGESFSIADIALGCAAHRWLNLPAERQDRPNLRRWYERIAVRPGAARALAEPVG